MEHGRIQNTHTFWLLGQGKAMSSEQAAASSQQGQHGATYTWAAQYNT